MAHAMLSKPLPNHDPQIPRDASLVTRIEAGEREAFEVLYERYFGRIYGFVARRLRNRADVEDTVQEVFASIFASLGSYRGEAPFPAWALGVARRVVASRFKKKRPSTVSLDVEAPSESVHLTMPFLQRAPTPLEHYECRERIGQLQSAASRRLSQEQRELFERHHLHHQSITELAANLRKSEDAVKSNLYRARKMLLAR